MDSKLREEPYMRLSGLGTSLLTLRLDLHSSWHPDDQITDSEHAMSARGFPH
jgi:hypothetical protein